MSGLSRVEGFGELIAASTTLVEGRAAKSLE